MRGLILFLKSTFSYLLAKNSIFAGMMETKYQRINPAEMFKVNVTRTIVKDTPPRMHYEYSYTVELRPTNNDFVNLFARLVSTHGKWYAQRYAAKMGVTENQLVVTLATLTGAGVREWGDIYVQTLVEALLRHTDWRIGRIAREAGFRSVSIFSRYFRTKYKCSPGMWR